jgi:hypothetical protein
VSASPTGPVRPARLAGFILLGVAVIAVGLGIFALADSASGQTTSSGPTSQVTAPETIPHTTTQPSTTTKAPPTTTTTTPPTSTYPSGQTTTVVPAPPVTTGPPAPPQVQVRVYNHSTIQGLAARAAADLTAAGYNVVSVSGYTGDIPTSTVYYSPAPGEQDAAQQIGQKFGMRVEPRFPGIADASPGVIVIVTKDFKG